MFWKQLKCYTICSLKLQKCNIVLVHSVVTDWFYTALSRLWQSSARLEIWLNALWKISVLAFFSSPYSYINLFLSCLVIKRTTPHFDSAPVHNGAEYFVISHFVFDCSDFLEDFLNFLAAKGQLISKCLLGVIVSTKKPTKFLKEFRPWPLKRGWIKKCITSNMLKKP